MQVRPRSLSALLGALLFAAVPAPGPRAPGDTGVRAGKWSRNKVPDGWVVVDTPHYQVQSQIGKDKASALGEHLEGMRLLYRDLLESRRSQPTFVVKVFADREQFMAYRGDDVDGDATVSAWYDRVYKELVTYDTGILLGRRDIPTGVDLAEDRALALPHAELQRIYKLLDDVTVAYTEDTARILSHEGWHQAFHAYAVSWVPMPAWLDEGLGEYFYTAGPTGGSRSSYAAGGINQARLRDLMRAFEDGRVKPFGLMLQYDNPDHAPNADVLYAQGWAMVYFLMTHRSPQYRAVIPNLIRDFGNSNDFHESTEKAFSGFDLEALDREWLGWLLTQTPEDPLKDLAREFGRKIRPYDLLASDEIRNVYGWHLNNPNAPSRVPARLAGDDR